LIKVKDHEQQIMSLQAKIGRLTMENDFLPRCSSHGSARAQGQNQFASWLASQTSMPAVIN